MAILSYFNLFNFSSESKIPPSLIENNKQSFNDLALVNYHVQFLNAFLLDNHILQLTNTIT